MQQEIQGNVVKGSWSRTPVGARVEESLGSQGSLRTRSSVPQTKGQRQVCGGQGWGEGRETCGSSLCGRRGPEEEVALCPSDQTVSVLTSQPQCKMTHSQKIDM